MDKAHEIEWTHTICRWLIASFSFSAIALVAGVQAPYGRYVVGAHRLFGFHVPGLFAWVVQEIPNLIAVGMCYFVGDPAVRDLVANKVLLGLFVMHYTNRTLIFPFLIRGGKGSALVPFLMALAFCTVNGYLQARTLTYLKPYDDEWLTDPRFIVGVAVFFIGFWINNHSDSILRNLRKPEEREYKIPRGGMFEYVSGANFFGEIIEWTGFAIACWSIPSVCFAITTALNIGPRAIQHHQWYKEKFKGEYPEGRKALIPFVL